MDHPTLLLIRGVPGSGKSYLTIALQQALGDDRVVVLDPDATDYSGSDYQQLSASLTAEGVDAKFHPYRFLRARAHAGIAANKYVIWNQAFTNLDGFNKTVINLRNYASEQGKQLPILVVEMTIDEATARQRVADRAGQGGHDVSPENFSRFMQDYVSFAPEGYSTIAVRGEDNIAESVDRVKAALQQL